MYIGLRSLRRQASGTDVCAALGQAPCGVTTPVQPASLPTLGSSQSFPDVPEAPEAIGLTANQIGGTAGAVVGVVLLILWLIWRIRSGVDKRLKEDLEYVEREAAVAKITHLERELAVATSAGKSVVDPNRDGVNEPPQVAAHTNSPGAPAVARKKQRFRPF
ncbi:hypothetical protein B0H16DRAFT_1500185 [Mycena metata]|uniref:Uncharacterized protein n=1 Tax=Mycena metata TaxID=1033252 RepID=A0AAD7NY29_9AGAR|nr:hypothetical protein B0H16DRAFT_1500185 [Mycena metata]